MKNKILGAMMAVAMASPVVGEAENTGHVNPFLAPYGTQFEIPPFDKIAIEDYVPAFTQGIEEARRDVAAIVANKETPTFENTIVALDNAGATLERVSRVFYSLSEADSSPAMEEIAQTVSPMVSRYSDEVSMNEGLFERIKYLYEHRDGLDSAQKRAVEESYKEFVRNGALLAEADKARLSELNMQLSDLYLKFNKNLLNATNAFAVIVPDKSRLSGLPASAVATAAAEAEKRGHKGEWAFTLHGPSRLAVLQYADDRQLRHDIYRGYTSLASSGEYNNHPVINEILRVRSAKAKLLGFPNYAAYQTDNVMAKTPENALNLLMQVWRPTVDKVKAEVVEMQQLANERGDKIKIEPWDYYYYAEKVRAKKYDLDENELRPYFHVDSVKKGIFTLAERLYDVKFKELPDAPKYHPDVTVYEVVDLAGNHVAVFMTDYFTRASKRQGAWMDELKPSYVASDGTVERPIIYNVCNFEAPTAEQPSLLTLDDVATVFHEFGHGLHGMLSRAKYKCQSGTAVDRDFVELPSQINEHWALEPELLKEYAHHYVTGETIPDELIAKLQAASLHNAGFNMAERVAASYLDLQYGLMDYAGEVDINAFEEKVVEELGMPREVEYRYHSTYFKHIFGSDHYASGYYTYLWAEVLDTDGFELFKERGVFDKATAQSFKENILEMGGSADPMELYVKFRGQAPTADALLRQHGLDKPAQPNADLNKKD
ncbi:MAG: M3 family metallopeptidase [Bacteroidales bacterium]|nr:M3 family metallopeptidase [Bacteroidales bacterium]